ncbi:type 1 fimbrial protein [Citrobacter koseri]|uniref:fimbrial protein n=1 Tax=Citrobacter koseri TaxID=545 RepID=UPI0019041F78|nr:fimbrial protein [Citrobacter koseri]MBJ9122323.1 type 1 fimbrial protein [Citrobacter koseri]MBJ9245689.1 type 1 fimbrial protein [Citrobacter koseri]
MKFNVPAVLIPAMLMASSAYAVEGETSLVKFNGNITEATCELSSGSRGQNVDMGNVATTAFISGPGSVTAPKNFSIDLENCGATAGTASVTFVGDVLPDGESQTLKTSEFSTTGVGVQILQNGTPLKLNGSEPSVAQTLNEGDNSLLFSARYISTLTTAQAGEANAAANFTLNYE